LRQQAELEGWPPPNHKRVWRVMRAGWSGVMMVASPSRSATPAVAKDGFEIACDNGERARVAFALDCCDQEAITFIGTISEHVGDMVGSMLPTEAVERRFGLVNHLPSPIEWLSGNGGCYVARDTRRFATSIGMIPTTTPLQSSQSNGMAEAFVAPSSATMPASGPARMRGPSCSHSRPSSTTTTRSTRTARVRL
jgi:putative transposase